MEGKQIFAERYYLKHKIGEGSFGNVWLAHDLDSDIDVAIKIYTKVDTQSIKDLKNEFKLTFTLNHTNLLHANYFSVYQNQPYLIMPYCVNGSLASQIGKVQNEIDVWKYIRDVAKGLEYLHERNTIHQDIKPTNILLDENWTCVISDFGESKNIKDTLRRFSNKDFNNGGSLPYMAPERFETGAIPIKASDIYSLGVSIYELIEGQLPFAGNGGMMQILGDNKLSFSKHWTKDLSDLITKCMQKNPWERPTAKDITIIAENKITILEKKHKREFQPLFASRKLLKFSLISVISLSLITLAYLLYTHKDCENKIIETEYHGELVNGQKHGWGHLCFSDSSYYDGNFKYDKYSGWGKRIYSDGSKYLGHWKENVRDGYGTYFSNGKVLCGIWKDDSLLYNNALKSQEEIVYGIDISKWQRTIDWSNLSIPINDSILYTPEGQYYQPIIFALIKATEGQDIIDPKFEQNFANAKKYNITRGAYHILSSLSPIENQVKIFVQTANLSSGDFPPILDVEPILLNNWDKKELKAKSIEWLKSIQAHYGVTPIIYTNENLYMECFDVPEFHNYLFWIANYGNTPNVYNWTLWQFSQNAKIRGISKGVETDLNQFNGSYNEFLQFIKMYGIK